MALKKLLKEIGLLLGIALSLAFVVNALSPNGIALQGNWDVSKGMVSAKVRSDTLISKKLEIELPEAQTLFKQGVLFVDARSEEDYKAGHIRGAVSLSVERFFDEIKKFQERYPDSTPLVTYCSGRECSDSHDLAENLMNAGYTDIRIFIDGYPVWEAQGLPVDK